MGSGRPKLRLHPVAQGGGRSSDRTGMSGIHAADHDLRPGTAVTPNWQLYFPGLATLLRTTIQSQNNSANQGAVEALDHNSLISWTHRLLTFLADITAILNGYRQPRRFTLPGVGYGGFGGFLPSDVH